MWLRQRNVVPEKMDAADLDTRLHREALLDLERMSRWSGTARNLAKELISLQSRKPLSEWRLLDAGCANGAMARDLADHLFGRLQFQITGWDFSPIAIELAKEQHLRWKPKTDLQGGKNCVTYEVRNLLDSREVEVPESEPPFDVVYCSLFLHHFDDWEAGQLLARFKQLARVAVIVDDLRRTGAGWWIAWLGTRLLSRSPVLHFDGPQSVRAAFTLNELRQLAHKSGLSSAQMRAHWPQRLLFQWER